MLTNGGRCGTAGDSGSPVWRTSKGGGAKETCRGRRKDWFTTKHGTLIQGGTGFPPPRLQ
jgi:hypothetical protein